jgi:hypothetical protein
MHSPVRHHENIARLSQLGREDRDVYKAQVTATIYRGDRDID